MNIQQAAEILGVKESTLQPFDVLDRFNNNNKLEGFLCTQSDHRYGSILIYKVNEIETKPQVIYCTPKLHYPFSSSDVERKYHFPKNVEQIRVYEKLDGTNICVYQYRDHEGNTYTTYKVRLHPVVGNSKFGPFADMWKELLNTPELLSIIGFYLKKDVSLSFEMYGYRNQHLIVYDIPLSAKWLFTINQKDATITPCQQPAFTTINSPKELIRFYNDLREQAEKENRKTGDNNELISGTEGYVLYVKCEGTDDWIMYKCKPESIEGIHWSGKSIPMSIIVPTVWNSLESNPEPTRECIVQLLLEEFTQDQIDESLERIDKAINNVLSTVQWRELVRNTYKSIGLDWERDGKQKVMRALSTKFDKSKMKNVFSALKTLGIVKE